MIDSRPYAAARLLLLPACLRAVNTLLCCHCCCRCGKNPAPHNSSVTKTIIIPHSG